MDAHRVHGEVHDEAHAADEPEPHELQPVGGPPHAIEQSYVRPHLYGAGMIAHPQRVASATRVRRGGDDCPRR